MKKKAFIVLGLVALTGAPRARAAAESGPAWLHVRVEEPGKGSKVHINLPLLVVEAALKAAPETVVSQGRIRLGHDGNELSVSDLRRVWKELKAAGDTDLVTVEERDEQVTIARRGNVVQIRVDQPRGRQKVDLDVPIAVVDALLAGPGETVDVRAALTELSRKRGDIVKVNDGDSTVRVWIDGVN
jgi:hypothetical protein